MPEDSVAELARQWAEATGWHAIGAAFLLGLDPRTVSAVRGHSDCPIVVYDPGGGAISVPGVRICTDFSELRRAAAEQIATGLHIAAYVSEEAEEKLGSDVADEFAQHIQATLNSMKIDQNTERSQGKDWVRCLLESLPYMAGSILVGSAKDALRGVPGIIVGSGPSLDRNARDLRRWSGHGVVLAAATAVPPLRQYGVIPDMVVVADRHREIGDLLRSAGRTAEMRLVGGLHVSRSVWRQPWRDRLLAVHFASGIGPWIERQLKSPSIPAGGSVTTVAAGCALALGCDPIILVGQDCALGPGDRYYSRAGRRMDWERGEDDDGRPVMILRGRSVAYLSEVPAWGGSGTVWAPGQLNHYRDFFERFVEDTRGTRTLINATEGGARIKGWTERRLRRISVGPHVDLDERLRGCRRLEEAELRRLVEAQSAAADHLGRVAARAAEALDASLAAERAADQALKDAPLAALWAREGMQTAREARENFGNPRAVMRGIFAALADSGAEVASMTREAVSEHRDRAADRGDHPDSSTAAA